MKIKKIEEKINFGIPLEVCKGLNNDDSDILSSSKKEMLIAGVAGTPDLDLDKQSLKPEGFILDYFLKNGFINYNHQAAYSPDCIIGEPIETKVDNEKFYLKSRLYPWSSMAKSIYEIACNLEKDTQSDRTLGYSVEGMTLQTKGDLVNKLLITGCAVTFVPKNNNTYLEICKGVTIDRLRDLRKQNLFAPIYSEVEKGIKTDYILNLQVGKKRILVDTDYNFHIRENENSSNSLEEIQKAIIYMSKAYKEGYIKESKKEEFIKLIKEKRKLLN